MAPMKRPATAGQQRYRGTWSLNEAARRLKTTKKHVRQLLGSGQMGFVQISGHIRVPVSEAERYMSRSG